VEPELLALGRRPLLIVSDYDGTLAPLTLPQAEALPLPELLLLLEALRDHPRHAFWILSGRRREELVGWLPAGLSIIGLHGMEWPGEPLPQIDGVEDLKARIPPYPGRFLEDKGVALAAHYRQAPDYLVPQIEAMLLSLPVPAGWERLRGKRVVEFRPRGFGKGQALERLIQQDPNRYPVFLGDDVTDEEGFARVQALGGVGIKVGPGPTEALYRLENLEAVAELFRAWIRGDVRGRVDPQLR